MVNGEWGMTNDEHTQKLFVLVLQCIVRIVQWRKLGNGFLYDFGTTVGCWELVFGAEVHILQP